MVLMIGHEKGFLMQSAYCTADHAGHASACLICTEVNRLSASMQTSSNRRTACFDVTPLNGISDSILHLLQANITLLGSLQQVCLGKRQAAAEVQCSSTHQLSPAACSSTLRACAACRCSCSVCCGVGASLAGLEGPDCAAAFRRFAAGSASVFAAGSSPVSASGSSVS